jgi:hypothetical protein
MSVQLVDLTTGETRTVGSGAVDSVTFSGKQMLIERGDGNLEIWNKAGTFLYRLIPQDLSYVPQAAAVRTTPVVVDPLLVQQRSDSALVLTDLRRGETFGILTLPGSVVGSKTGLALSPDADQLITVTESPTEDASDGLLVRWELSTEAWVGIACDTVGRDLTREEWNRYVGSDPPKDLRCRR